MKQMGLKAKIRAKKAYRHPAMGELACADLGEFAGNPALEAAGFFQIKVERAALQYGLAHVSLVVDLAHRLGNGDEGQAEQQGGEQFFHHGSLVWIV